MNRNTQERLPDELLDFEEGLLSITEQKKKWYQFKTVGKFFSGLVAWLPGPVSQFVSDAWRTVPQFFSSESFNPRMRDFIVHGSIALVIVATLITTTILTMGLGPLIMAGGALAAAGIIGGIAVAGIIVSAIWGGLGAACQGLLRYLDENWSNVPEATFPIPIEEVNDTANQNAPVRETYDLVSAGLPAALNPPLSDAVDIPQSPVKPPFISTSNPEQSQMPQQNAGNPYRITL